MPDYGTLSTKNHPYTIPAVAPLYPPPPWELKDAQILQMSFEIDKAVLLQWLPTTLLRSVPPYSHFIVAHFPNSPVGPFTVAHQVIICRFRVLARAYNLQTVVDNPDAAAALREIWGFPAKVGKVTLERRPDYITGTVERPAGTLLASVTMTEMDPIAPAEIRYDAYLNLRLTPPNQDGKPPDLIQLVQFDPSYTLKECYRGHSTVSYPSRSEADPWYLAEFRHFISCTFAEVDMDFPWARYIQEFP